MKKKAVSLIFFIFGRELALIWKINLAKFEVHQVNGLREITRRNFEISVKHFLSKGWVEKPPKYTILLLFCFLFCSKIAVFSHTYLFFSGKHCLV